MITYWVYLYYLVYILLIYRYHNTQTSQANSTVLETHFSVIDDNSKSPSRNSIPSNSTLLKTNPVVLDSTLLRTGFGIENQTVFRRNSIIPDNRTCGFQAADCPGCSFLHVFGGRDAFINEFPWMALLGYTNRKNTRRWRCGATIISSRYVLTAAHCVVKIPRPIGNLTHVRLGEHDLDTDVDCSPIRGGKIVCNEKPVDAEVEQVIVHPGYRSTKRNGPYDIALIRISLELNYTTFIRPICLPDPTYDDIQYHGLLTTAGWGYVTDYKPTTIKQTVPLPYQQREKCNRSLGNNVKLLSSQICVGGVDGQDTCTGDSGGPLMKKIEHNKFVQWFQVGVVSFGDADCGVKPAVYTKIPEFVIWIHDNVKP